MEIDLNNALNHLDIVRQINQEELVANAIFIVAIAYLERNLLDEATEALNEANYLCCKLDNRSGEAQVALRMVDLALLKKNYIYAEQKANKALDLFQIIDDKAGQVNAYERLAIILSLAGRNEEAIVHLESAVIILMEASDKIGEILIQQRLASLYRVVGRLSNSLESYEKLLHLAMAVGERERIALALFGIGTIAAEQGRLKAALIILDRACILYSNLGQKKVAIEIQEKIIYLANQVSLIDNFTEINLT